jgi:hypothetical protein
MGAGNCNQLVDKVSDPKLIGHKIFGRTTASWHKAFASKDFFCHRLYAAIIFGKHQRDIEVPCGPTVYLLNRNAANCLCFAYKTTSLPSVKEGHRQGNGNSGSYCSIGS